MIWLMIIRDDTIGVVFSSRRRENRGPPTQLHNESSNEENLVTNFEPLVFFAIASYKSCSQKS